MRVVEIESLAEFDRRVGGGRTSARGWHLQSVDLSGRTAVLAGLDLRGAVFLGCELADPDDIRRRGGLVFPDLPDVPFDPYRSALYTPAELYAGLDAGYPATLDARVYAWDRAGQRDHRSMDRTLASALHDHSVDDALEEFGHGRRLVGVMGGHAVRRGSPEYRQAALLGRSLAAFGTVATGGGPGAMEAANLGALLSGAPESDLDEALALLARVPDFAPDVTAWARAGMTVRERFEGAVVSLGVPTWFYGHEPPNVFADVIAKYLRNAIREDVLLRITAAGIVFLPGAAGTVQEVFQAACENYYASPEDVSPMVLVGRAHWTETLPVWGLLESLARDRAMRVHLVESVDEVPALLT